MACRMHYHVRRKGQAEKDEKMQLHESAAIPKRDYPSRLLRGRTDQSFLP
jgi:hypothetical protein